MDETTPAAGSGTLQGAQALAALPAVPEPTADDRPSRWSTVRVILTPCALLVLAALCFVAGWPVPGIILCVLAVLVVLGEVAIGWVVIKYALRDHANMFKILAPLLRGDSAKTPRVVAAATPEEERREKAVDRAVGFGLTRAAAVGATAIESSGQSDEDRACLREHVLEEREATYEWLQEMSSWQRVSTEGEDGIRLVGELLAPHSQDGRWVILCHGYAGTWNSMLQYARRWAEAGYNLLVPHMRAHGESGGDYIGMGWLDRRDVVAWARWLSEGGAGLPCTSIVLFGHSMGASSVGLASGEPDLPAQVCAAIGDCSFDGCWRALSTTLQAAGAPVHPTLDLVRLNLMARRGGYDLAQGDVAQAVGARSLPRLFVHGLADPTVPPVMARVLFEAAAGPKELVVVPGAGHCQSSLRDPEGYWNAVLSFANAHQTRSEVRI